MGIEEEWTQTRLSKKHNEMLLKIAEAQRRTKQAALEILIEEKHAEIGL